MSDATVSAVWNTATKVLTAVIVSGILAVGAAGIAMRDQLNRLEVVFSLGMDGLESSISRIEINVSDANALARQNAADIAQIKNTRFTEQDAEKALRPLEMRLNALEKRGRR